MSKSFFGIEVPSNLSIYFEGVEEGDLKYLDEDTVMSAVEGADTLPMAVFVRKVLRPHLEGDDCCGDECDLDEDDDDFIAEDDSE